MTEPASGPATDELTRASVVGLGRIGAPLAACLAAGGISVIGMDIDRRKVDRMNAGAPPVSEPGLTDLLASARSLRATTSMREAVIATDITFVTVPTPPNPDGSLSMHHLASACTAIGDALRDKDGPHVVAVTSTVMPGTIGGPLTQLITNASGRVCGSALAVVYVPEFVALGTAIDDYLEPDFVLIGEDSPGAAPGLERFFRRVCRNDPPVMRTAMVAAELAKLAINAFLGTKVSFANALADLAQRLPGCDIDAVTSVMALDRRIDPRYLTGAMPFGGPCLPRDTDALAELARRAGAVTSLWDAVLEINDAWLRALADAVEVALPPGGVAGVYGIAFKPGTGVVERSAAARLAGSLAERGIATLAFDPQVSDATVAALGPGIEPCSTLEELLARADVLVLAAPVRALPPSCSRRASIVIDCWRSLDPGAVDGADHVMVGRGPRVT